MSEYPAIVVAIWKDDLERVRQLSGTPDVLDPDGRTPLIAAAIDSKLEAARILIAAGADVDFQDPGGWSALHFAAQSGSAEMVRLLLDASATVDPRDSDGNTPLWRATFESRGEGRLIRLLLEHGADPNRENDSGVSPAGLARSIANFDVAQFFPEVAK